MTPTGPAAGPARVAALDPPDLDDPARFVARRDVPVLDAHDHRSKGDVDEALLHLLARNTNARCARGDLVALTLGHTNADGPEADQPPFVGWDRNFSVGAFRDAPCLLADFFFDAADAKTALQFPHRSIERVRSDADPSLNYIDYVCLLRRPPERSLGLLTYGRRLPQGASVVRYERDMTPAGPPVAAPAASPPDPATPTEDMMTPEQNAELAAAIAQATIDALKPLLDAIAKAKQAEAKQAEAKQAEAKQAEAKSATKAEAPADDDRVRMRRDLAALRDENRKLRDDRDGLAAQVSRLKYNRSFDEMEREGVVFDRAEEMAAILKLPAEHRDRHLDRMRERYKRGPAGRKVVARDEATERRELIDYAIKHGIDDIVEARLRYRRDQDLSTPAAPDDREERGAIVAYAAKHGIERLEEARVRYRRERAERDES